MKVQFLIVRLTKEYYSSRGYGSSYEGSSIKCIIRNEKGELINPQGPLKLKLLSELLPAIPEDICNNIEVFSEFEEGMIDDKDYREEELELGLYPELSGYDPDAEMDEDKERGYDSDIDEWDMYSIKRITTIDAQDILLRVAALEQLGYY